MVQLKRRSKDQSKASDEYGTPEWLFDVLNEEFNFRLDVCASHENHKCSFYYTEAIDGLDHSNPWTSSNFCNPPYSNILPWYQRGNLERDACNLTTVYLSKFDPSTAHGRLLSQEADELRIIEHRIKFEGATNCANFPSVIGVVRPRLYARKSGPLISFVDFREYLKGN